MPLRQHLRELRNRLLLAVAGILLGAVVGWLVYPWVFDTLSRPLVDVAESRGDLVALNFAGVATPLDLQLKIALFVGVLVASPWWIYQLWAFVTPGLTRTERRYTVGFVAAAVPLFFAGAAVAWWVIPVAVDLLVGLTPQDAVNVVDAQLYLGFVMRMVLAFGVAFLLPVVMVGLTMAGVVGARTWLRGWRWAVLAAAVFGAVATPSGDAISMFAIAVPMWVLYFGALGVCALVDRRRRQREETA
jgi:sec-independent protein translocase protein TatC